MVRVRILERRMERKKEGRKTGFVELSYEKVLKDNLGLEKRKIWAMESKS
jgi:hypothetical protein